jgi:hypothetical protein
MMDNPNVSGTNRKWNIVAAANCNLERNNTSIVFLLTNEFYIIDRLPVSSTSLVLWGGCL